MNRLYHPSAFDTANPVPSHWNATAPRLATPCPPLEGEDRCEVAVIGGGFTGLWAAYRLATEYGQEVTLLDAAEPGWGASGRNGGFCCMGSSKLGHGALIRRYGEEAAKDFLRTQAEAVEAVRDFLDSQGEDADRHSEGEITLAHKPNRVQELREEARFLQERMQIPARFLEREELRQMGVAGPEFHGGLHVGVGFALHPLKYARCLAQAAANAGVRLRGSSAVTAWHRSDDGRHALVTDRGRLLADKVILATNGYLREDLPAWIAGRALPALSSILVTRPLSEDEQASQGWTSDIMAADSRQLLHYFRKLPDGRFLFGGRGGIDASPQGAEAMQRRLRRAFERMFPAWRGVETESFWRGLVCLTYDLVPYVGPIGGPIGGIERAWTALAYHGNGVAMSGHAGRALADLSMGAGADIPAAMRGPLRPFPLPALRKLYLRAAYLGFEVQDRWL